MHVIKRDGRVEDLDFEKIHWRIKSVCSKPTILEFQKKERPDDYNVFHKLTPILNADVDTITKKTIEGLYNNISSTDIDRLSVEVAQEMCTIHPDNSVLATRILVSNIQKNILEIMLKRFPKASRNDIKNSIFKYVMTALYFNLDKHGENAPLISPYVLAIAFKYEKEINFILDFSRDFTNHDYLGIKTLEKGYLFQVNMMENFTGTKILVETPSIADMRIAIGIACAPSPCPQTYPKEDVISFITSYPEVIKEKYRERDLTELYDRDEPHKHKYIDLKLFKKLYWESRLEKEIQTVQVSETQWREIRNTYNGTSTGKFTPATPTRFAAGTLRPQGSSCFLIAMKDDSLKGIYETLQEQAQISKHAGGVGIWCSNIRSTGSYISGTNGNSNGVKPMLRVFNASTEYVDQGGGKRPGSIAFYIEIWHADIIDFVRLKKKTGADSDRARRLFYALWIADEFFRCWKEGKDWYLFDPAVCPKLYNSYDEEFSSTYLSDEYVNAHKDTLRFTYNYRKYIRQGKFEKKISIETLMEEIVDTIKESSIYMLAKDACNRKSNQKNLGVIKSSNLCSEIIQYSDANETAVCNLSSICLNKYVRPFVEGDNEKFKYDVSIQGEPVYYTFDFDDFGKFVSITTVNTDRLIDINYYPTEASRRSNTRHRAVGLGIQGEADMLAMLRLPWNGKEANRLRFYISERMYYAALSASVQLAKENGCYETFRGSPASQGKLQFDLWKDEGKNISFPMSMDWESLKKNIVTYGLRNSLLIAEMPTSSTSSIMGNSPSIEPFNSLVYVRKGGSTDVTLINTNLVKDLMSINMWNKKISDKILQNHGSIQNITEIPKKLRDSYLTAYDLESADIIDAAFTRAWFVDQSQSMNLFVKNVTMAELSKAWTRGWMRGLKTLSYYIRSRPSTFSQKAQLGHVEKEPEVKKVEREPGVCYRDDPDCLACGS